MTEYGMKKGTSLKITIHPPFYWSTASKLLYFVLVCIAFGFVIRFIIKRTEKKHTAEINKLNANKEKRSTRSQNQVLHHDSPRNTHTGIPYHRTFGENNEISRVPAVYSTRRSEYY